MDEHRLGKRNEKIPLIGPFLPPIYPHLQYATLRKQKSIHRHDSFPVSMNIGERREEGIEGGETPPLPSISPPSLPLPSFPSFVPPYTHHPFPLLFLFFYSTFVSHSIEYSFSWVFVLYDSLHPSSLLSSFLSIVSISSIYIRFPFTSHLVK